jgi:hypothetical protein
MDLNDDIQKLKDERDRLLPQIKMSIEIISPEQARIYLGKNLSTDEVHNRTLPQKSVLKYASDMLAGRWKVGPPIMFDINKKLIDGQGRLWGVVKSNKSILALVISGVDPNVFDAIDCGRNRTLKDTLSSVVVGGNRLVKPATVGSAINMIYSIARNHTAIDKNRGLLTNSEVVEIVKNDFDYYNEPFVGKKSSKMIRWRKNIKLTILESVLACFYYINKKQHGKVVDDFLTIITSSGINTPPVVHEFRDMVIYNKGKKSDEKGYLPPIAVFRLIDTLFKYNLKGDLLTRKHISVEDLKKINE